MLIGEALSIGLLIKRKVPRQDEQIWQSFVITVTMAFTIHIATWSYYYEIFMPFLVFVYEAITKIKFLLSKRLHVMSIILAVGLFLTSQKMFLLKINTPKESMPQYQIAEIINQSDDTSTITFLTMDFGVFTEGNLLPTAYHFVGTNFNDKALASQIKYIEEGQIKFVITCLRSDEKKCEAIIEETMNGRYEIIYEQEYDDVGWCRPNRDCTVRLYRRMEEVE